MTASPSRSVAAVRQPAYHPDAVGIGVLHVGPGAFHRAHQAAFLDDLLARDASWGIAAVALRSAETVDALARQDGRYVLRTLEAEPRDRIIAAHRASDGPAQLARAVRRFTDPGLRLVTATVTEKGYCRDAAGGLDRSHPDVAADLAGGADPVSLPGFLFAGLGMRQRAGLGGVTLMSCDNLPGNSAVMRRTLIDFAEGADPGLARWIADHCRFADTMVDAITPATTPDLIRSVAQATGLADAIPVHREPFAQWVVEDCGSAAADALAGVGVTLSRHVDRWEAAKLRIVNGAHSMLAYRGLLAGHDTVDAAIGDPTLRRDAQALLAETQTTLQAPDGEDLDAYAATTLERFANPHVRHQLRQIATDGSQKLRQRLVQPLIERQAAGQASPTLARAVAGWMAWLIAEVREGRAIPDPLADTLARAAGRNTTPDAIADLLAVEAVFPRGLPPAAVGDIAQETLEMVGRPKGAPMLEGGMRC